MLPFKTSLPGAKMFAATIVCLITFSFAALAGGDTYQIYLNNKLVFKQKSYNPSVVDLNNLQLTKTNYNDDLVVYYSHCGVTGTGRSIEIKDENNNVLKQWKFKDAQGSNASMVIPVKDILELQQQNPKATLNLYYFSEKYLPKGRMLASIKMENKNMTMNDGTIRDNEMLVTKNLMSEDLLLWRI
jgi:hypothetical protein